MTPVEVAECTVVAADGARRSALADLAYGHRMPPGDNRDKYVAWATDKVTKATIAVHKATKRYDRVVVKHGTGR